ncbi:MAG TPA: glycosyltransferase [Bacteroidia bacterium]|nr:glycosyltransferase [Bacteroidia bacterium]
MLIFTLLFNNKIIFYSALDWGLGHATRSVPIIRQLLKNNSVILGVTPLTKTIFDEEFPEIKKVDLPSYDIKYSKVFPLWMKMGLSAPRISRIITDENKVLDKIITENKIDVAISDNRFGLHSDKIHSVFITHQLFLKAPVFENFGQSINQKYITKFNEVWIPDFENEQESLSGELSHGKHPDSYRGHENVKYIGPQSRLNDVIIDFEKDKYDYLILLSGPEPTRTVLEKGLLKKIKSSGKRIAFVRGRQEAAAGGRKQSENGIDIFDFPSKEELKKLILSSKKIICRSGYSTLMDMHLLGKKELILIPTPGQTEQEYLAEYWKQKFNSEYLPQNKISNFTL